MSSPTASLTTRLRSFSLSSTPAPPARSRTFSSAQQVHPINLEFCHIIRNFLEVPKLYNDEEMLQLIKGPTDEIMNHCLKHLGELSGEALLLRIWTICSLCKMFAPTIDHNQLIYGGLCTLAESFFAQNDSGRFDVLYGDIAWFHDIHTKQPQELIDFALQYAKSTEQNGPIRCAMEPPLVLCDTKHPWQLKKLPARTIVHHWYALSYWLMKLAPLKAPRGSSQSTDQLYCILAKWIESVPTLQAKTIVDAAAGLGLIAIYLEPDKALGRSPRSPRRAELVVQESVNSFFKFCRELNNEPLNFCTWMRQPDAMMVARMALNLLRAEHVTKILGFLHNQKENDEPYMWLTKIDSFEGEIIQKLIRDNQFDNETLFQFFQWIMCPNKSFSVRLNIAQEILTKLKNRKALIDEVQQFFNQLHVFFDEARTEGYFENVHTKKILCALVDAVFAMDWYFIDAPKIFINGTVPPSELRQLLVKIKNIEEQLYLPHELEDRFYQKCIQVCKAEITKVDPAQRIAFKNAILSVTVYFYGLISFSKLQQELYPVIREIGTACNHGELGIVFDQASGRLIVSEVTR